MPLNKARLSTFIQPCSGSSGYYEKKIRKEGNREGKKVGESEGRMKEKKVFRFERKK